MSGTCQDWNADAPGGRLESEAAVREGLAQAMSALTVTQGKAARFMAAEAALGLGRPIAFTMDRRDL